LQVRRAPEAATLIGSGKVGELERLAAALEADVVIFDQELTPTQQRNLEKALACKVLDRTQLILDIFARRARTREGRLQVELAQLHYLLPRLTGHGAAMSRLGGGIGTRGPGETKLETDRRRIARRLRSIERELESVRAGRAVHRERRSAVPLATAALVGYTNAGKSTLFNFLTRAAVLADARMFATLDPTVRSLALPSRRKILLSDTVGFIRNLPTTLVEAFRATLEEINEASLVIHVLDVASPHALVHHARVLEVLGEIGAEGIRRLLVLNKTDIAPEGAAEAFRSRPGVEVVSVSARTGAGIPEFLAAVDRLIPLDPVETVRFRIPDSRGAEIGFLHARSRILTIAYSGGFCEIEAEAPESVRNRLKEYLA
jgi:GTPase